MNTVTRNFSCLSRQFFRLETSVLLKSKINVQLIKQAKLHDTAKYLQNRKRGIYVIDETETEVSKSSSINKYTYRTCTCGELRIENAGQTVVLCGWLEYQRLNKFMVIRDAYGHTQLLVKENDNVTQEFVGTLPYESIIKVKGTVQARPKEMINPKQATGEIEVIVDSFTILNKAESLPFNIREFQKAKEVLRLQYRYLDLRFDELQRNLRIRSQFFMKMRKFLIEQRNFVDVETPTLFKATPGGAQEFIVPTRFPGQFYSLVQSPQQFKQILMAGAIDRYFQIARCYRDEGSRSDRQPEFTQLDIEMSFTDVEGIITLIEELLQYSWPDSLPALPATFPRISYKDALEMYGSDKPDIRYEFKLTNLTDIFKKNMELGKIEPDFGAYSLAFNHPYTNLTSKMKVKLSELSKKMPKIKFIQSKIGSIPEWSNKMSNLIGYETISEVVNKLHLQNDSVIFLAFGDKEEVLLLLGMARTEFIKQLEEKGHKIIKEGMFPLWVVDFPLFEKGSTPEELKSVHHPFTAPQKQDEALLFSNPLQVKALAYDLVLNGNEVGGGSIRIHDKEQQRAILQMLNIKQETLQHMLTMLGSGCPPHGGIALGLDRLLATMLKTNSIRDVIAFPKTFEGRDPISGAPSAITEDDKRLYHLEIVTNEK